MVSKTIYGIVRDLDIEAARPMFRQMGFPANSVHPLTGKPVDEDEIILAGLHKARIMAPLPYSNELRDLSRKWLEEHRYEIPGSVK